MIKKTHLIYTILAQFNSKEVLRFKQFLSFYYRKPELYLELLSLIVKLNSKLETGEEFPEHNLIARFSDSKKLTKLKHNFKTSLFSFLRYTYLEDKDFLPHLSKDLNAIVEAIVSFKYNKNNLFMKS